MSSVIFAPFAQAAGFAIGCLALHMTQRHAVQITPYLVLAAALLLSLVLAALTLQRANDWLPIGAGYLI